MMLHGARHALRRRVVATLAKSPPLLNAALAIRAAVSPRHRAVARLPLPAPWPLETAPSFAFRDLLSDIDFVALDVGAAHWLPHHWRPFENEFAFVLVEPDKAACAELEKRIAQLPAGRERYSVVAAALSKTGGARRFYRTNQPTGSSMLKPAVLEEDERALFEFPAAGDNSDYVFPVTEMEIDTVTLARVLTRTAHAAFHMIKLDTQGTELEIVQGLGEGLRDTILVQMETGDHGFYLDKPGLAETLGYMNSRGFRLFDLQLARNELPLRGSVEAGYGSRLFPSDPDHDPAFVARLWEVDAVFVRDPVTVVKNGDIDTLRRIIVALCVYRMFGEAFQLTGLAEARGLWNGITASRYRRDIVACHRALRQWLARGNRLHWERL
jgi:FkbM family methyltransferase